jgi:Uma2 family endonuclease
MDMRLAKPVKKPTPAEAMFLLENGATMDQPTFHALYKLTPEGFKAELIEGTVYVASPVSGRHGGPHAKLIGLMVLFMESALGVRVFDNTTNILGHESEPQPDVALILSEEAGGRTRIDDEGYIHGAAELVCEVAHSTSSIDLGRKRAEYEAAGTNEYLVVLVHENKLRWFRRADGQFIDLEPDSRGILKSRTFPGFWLSADTFFSEDLRRSTRLLRKGLASPEHSAFAKELKARRTKHRKRKGK